MKRLDLTTLSKIEKEKEELDSLSIKDMLNKIDETIPEEKE
jgi:hypothetical protein